MHVQLRHNISLRIIHMSEGRVKEKENDEFSCMFETAGRYVCGVVPPPKPLTFGTMPPFEAGGCEQRHLAGRPPQKLAGSTLTSG